MADRETGITATVTLCCQFQSEHYDFRELKRTVRDAIERADQRERRFHIAFDPLDEGLTSNYIPAQIEESIRRAAIVVFDISDLNPNVIYELGIARGENKPSIILREEGASAVQLPHDLYTLRYELYRRDRLDRLESVLTEKIVEVASRLVVEDLIPQEQVERILSTHLRVIETNADFAATVEEFVAGCRKNLYFIGAAGLAVGYERWVELCRTHLADASAHRIVDLRTLRQIYDADQDQEAVEEYCAWLARYYALVRDGVFRLYSSREAGSSRSGISFLVRDQQDVLIAMGKIRDGFHHKALAVSYAPAGRIAHEYAKNLALTSREIRPRHFARLFTLAEPLRELPGAIEAAADKDAATLRQACRDWVDGQLARLDRVGAPDA